MNAKKNIALRVKRGEKQERMFALCNCGKQCYKETQKCQAPGSRRIFLERMNGVTTGGPPSVAVCDGKRARLPVPEGRPAVAVLVSVSVT